MIEMRRENNEKKGVTRRKKDIKENKIKNE